MGCWLFEGWWCWDASHRGACRRELSDSVCCAGCSIAGITHYIARSRSGVQGTGSVALESGNPWDGCFVPHFERMTKVLSVGSPIRRRAVAAGALKTSLW